MNPIQEITNVYIEEIKFNAGVMLEAIDLGPPPQMVRTPSYNEEVPLITDGLFQNTPSEFKMPEPCEKCYIFSCNGECSQETELGLLPRQLSFEEEMDLPPPPALTRIHTNAHLPYDEPEDEEEMDLPPPQALTRIHKRPFTRR